MKQKQLNNSIDPEKAIESTFFPEWNTADPYLYHLMKDKQNR